jgi:hypothetical protein
LLLLRLAFIFERYLSSVDEGVRVDDEADEAFVTDMPQTVETLGLDDHHE